MAVFTEQDLGLMSNPLDILNEATFVDEAEIISPATVPMVENSYIGGVVVRFKDVESISESYGLDYIDSALLIAEQNNIDPAYMAVAIDEADIILDPDIVQEIGNVVVIPQNKNSYVYKFCESCINNYVETENENYLQLLIENDFMMMQQMHNQMHQQHMDMHQQAVNLHNQMHQGFMTRQMRDLNKTVQQASKEPKAWISKKIASLRSIYKKWLDRAKAETDIGRATNFKRIAAKILDCIDKLLEKLQNASS